MSIPPYASRVATSQDAPADAPKELAWVSIAKGIGIIQVVWHHVAIGLQESKVGLAPPFNFVKSFTHSYNMPFFFFLAGLFAHRLLKNKPSDFAAVVARRIIYPYIVWSILQTAIFARFGLVASKRSEFTHMFHNILIEPYIQYWFLLVLFVFVSLYYLLARWRAGEVVLLLAGLFLCLSPIRTGIHVVNKGEGFLLFYMLGAIIGPHLLRRPFRVSPFAAVGLLGALVALELYTFGATSKLTALAFSVIGITAMLLLARAVDLSGGNRCLEVLGRNSLEIFLAHFLFTSAARGLLLKGMGVTNLPVHILVGIVAGLTLPLALAYLASLYNFSFIFKLQGPRRTNSSLGFESSGELTCIPLSADMLVNERVNVTLDSSVSTS